jgi:hypothetical protein
MTQFAPLDPFSSAGDQGIPAADPGQGAPETAEGYGVGAEEPDVIEPGDDDREARQPESTPFDTPDPGDVSRR